MEMYLVVTSSHAKYHETDIWEYSCKFLGILFYGSTPRHFWNINLALFIWKKI